jgi:hypothetical protein
MANQATVSAYAKAYNSFSGIDIKGVFANKVIAELQAISYSITREKAPIYTMGSADPRAFSRGKRGIAGTLIFIMFDRHTILGQLSQLKFLSDIDDIRPQYREAPKSGTGPSSGIPFGVDLASVSKSGAQAGGPLIVQQSESDLQSVDSDQEIATPWYVDQVPPFDVTLAAANEYGALAVMSIQGVELLNEGYGVSIDDIVSEQQFTYVARSVLPWTPVPSPKGAILASQGAST